MAHALVWNGREYQEIDRKLAEKAAARGELHAYIEGVWICTKDGKHVEHLQHPEFYARPVKKKPTPKKKPAPKKKVTTKRAEPKKKPASKKRK